MLDFLKTKERILKKEIAIRRTQLKELQQVLAGIKPASGESARIETEGLHSNVTVPSVQVAKGVKLKKDRSKRSNLAMALRKVVANFIYKQGGYATFNDIRTFLMERFPGYIVNLGFIDQLLYRNRDLFFPSKTGYSLLEGELSIDLYEDIDESILEARECFHQNNLRKYGKP